MEPTVSQHENLRNLTEEQIVARKQMVDDVVKRKKEKLDGKYAKEPEEREKYRVTYLPDYSTDAYLLTWKREKMGQEMGLDLELLPCECSRRPPMDFEED